MGGETLLENAAKATEKRPSDRARGSLHGVPFALKDVIDAEGLATTAHSKLLRDEVAVADAEVTSRLRKAGGILLGKLATHEFAIGGPSFDLPWPPARNPWNPMRHPGASSSGSAAGLAAGFFPAALGTDTGGSVRFPASACGIVGMKPTYGLVSRHGTFPLSFSCDVVGPMTRNVADNALLLSVIAGADAKDPASAGRAGEDYLDAWPEKLDGIRIGVARRWHTDDEAADARIVDAIDEAVALLVELGAVVDDIDPGSLHDYAACAHIIRISEAYAIHKNWLEAHPENYGASARERLMRGASYSAADYVQALRWRTRLLEHMATARQSVDVVIAASNLDQPCAIDDIDAFDAAYARQARVPFSLTGEPALALPIGFDDEGMPLSMQIAAAPFQEATIYRVAFAYEKAAGWSPRHPEF